METSTHPSLFLCLVFIILIVSQCEARGAPQRSSWLDSRRPKVFQPGQASTLYTTSRDSVTFLTEDRTSFAFRVKTCSDALITLTGLAGADREEDVTVAIGADNNNKTQIIFVEVAADTYTPDVLHCSEFRSFWISWKTQLLQVGSGLVVGRNVILGSSEAMYVNKSISLQLRSGLDSSSAIWEVQENSADLLEMTTPTSYGYQRLWRSVTSRSFISLGVTACSDAHILLTSQQGKTEGKVYEVVFGADGNKYTLIRTRANGGDEYLERTVAGKLSCDKEVVVWISWFNHGSSFATIKVGLGHVYGNDVILYVMDTTEPVIIRHMAVSTGNGARGTWRFEEDLEDRIVLNTQLPPGVEIEKRYRQVWVESVERNFMTFKVKSCSEVGVHFSRFSGLVDVEFGVELLIGAENNKKTILRSLDGPDEAALIASEDTADILDCDESRPFWITWEDGYFRMGKGRIYDTDLVLQGRAPGQAYIAYSINSIQSEALWTLKERSGENIQLVASQTDVSPLDMWRTVETRQELTFQVKACSDVTVLLSPTLGVDESSFYYSVKLGIRGTNKTTIELVMGSKPVRILAENEVDDLLSCSSWREFYISWWEGRITVGRGRFQGVLLSAFLQAEPRDSANQISALALKPGEAMDMQWSFPGDPGDLFIYKTPKVYDYVSWIELRSDTNYVTFDVTACSDAHVVMSESLLNLETRMLEVVISGSNNTASEIRAGGPSSTVYANVTHQEGLLSCWDSRSFWLRWDNASGLIEVGGGNPLLSSGSFLSWTNPKPFPFKALAISTNKGYSGRWYFREDMGASTLFPTHGPVAVIGSEETWRTVLHARSVTFGVRAPSEVHVTLAAHVGMDHDDALDVVLGSSDNSVSYIRSAGGGDVYVKADTPKILDPDNFRDFWISWYEGEVQLGKGLVPGNEVILGFQVFPTLTVRAVRFSSDFAEQSGVWSVRMHRL